ncbi:hypothetical protein DMC47_16165 [Nostoc sp. 3335mG]|nr:hypothetical protein DMC47_16165 [Nostoc sp. 3335mG]
MGLIQNGGDMRILSIAAFVAACQFGCSDANGQTKPPAKPSDKTELRLELTPKFGETLIDTEGNQPVDESELGLAVRFVRPLSADFTLEAIPRLAYSPQVYDDKDPTSQARVLFELRHRLSIGKDGRPLRYTSAGEIGLEPFVRYTPSWGFQDAFGDHAFFDNNFGLGARVENKVWFHCRRRWIIAAGLGCNPERKVAARLSPQLQYTVSDQTKRRRLTPLIEARVEVPIRDVNLRLVSSFESRRFTELRTTSGDLQRDGRASANLSVDFAPAIPKLRRILFGDETNRAIINDFTMEIGLSYVRNRSNNPTANFDRIFFAPAITYTRQLD